MTAWQPPEYRLTCRADHRPEGMGPGAVLGTYSNYADASRALEMRNYRACDLRIEEVDE